MVPRNSVLPLAHCNISSFDSYVANLTSSYADQSNEATMVSSSIFILVLAGTFFYLVLLRHFSAVRSRKLQRLLLSSVLSIFLPVMSYLFSEAKNSDQFYALQMSGQKPDLPRRAGVILVWMLLVELLRNNADEIRMRGYDTSGIIQRAGRVVWLGSLVFFNVRSVGRKAVSGCLWILCLSKLVQRVAYTENGKRSYLHHKNSRLIASYMSQRLLTRVQHADVDGVVEHAVQVPVEVEHAELIMERCEYIVMGEEELVKEATAHGYKLYNTNNPDEIMTGSIVTVGKVWGTKLSHICHGHDLRRLSLSFALFKILRRRFEHRGEMSVEETSDFRELLLSKGGLFGGEEDDKQAEAVFQVMNDEVQFLREYYHSVVPVVLASPFFLLSNYLLLPIVILGLWFMTVALCGNGDLRYAFKSILRDNYILKFGITKLSKCVLAQVTKSPQVFFSLVDFCITFLLIIIFFYDQLWELFLFVLSNWFVVSLLCNYVSKPKWRESCAFVWAFRCIMCVRSIKMPHTELSFKQFSALSLRRPLIFATPDMLLSLTAVRSVTVPVQVKRSIVEYLNQLAFDASATLSNGKSALENKHMDLFPGLSWACESESVAEVILTWHIATSLILLQVSRRRDGEEAIGASSDAMVVARRLSEYCAYLVVFHPELLPDNKDKTEHVFKTMKKELRSTLGFVDYYFSGQDARAREIMKIVAQEKEEECSRWTENNVLKNGAKLAKVLVARTSEGGADHVWQVLADVWTEVMVYVAPSSQEVHVKGHENLLVQGPEFVTLLWALTTHAGISRVPTHHPY